MARMVPIIVEWDIPREYANEGPNTRQLVPEPLFERCGRLLWDEAIADYLIAKTGWVVVNWDFEANVETTGPYDQERITCENPYGWTERRTKVECELFVGEIERYMGKVTAFQERHGI